MLLVVTCWQDVFKTSCRSLQRNNFLSFKTSSRPTSNTSSENIFKTSSRRICKTSSRSFQDVFKKTSCNCVLKTSWKTKKCYMFSTSSARRMFAGRLNRALCHLWDVGDEKKTGIDEDASRAVTITRESGILYTENWSL